MTIKKLLIVMVVLMLAVATINIVKLFNKDVKITNKKINRHDEIVYQLDNKKLENILEKARIVFKYGNTYSISNNGTILQCLETSTSKTKWMFKLEKVKQKYPLITNGKVYCYKYGYLLCVDVFTGIKLWEYKNNNEYINDNDNNNKEYSPIFLDGKIILQSHYITGQRTAFEPIIATKIICIDEQTGNNEWSYETEDNVVCDPIIVSSKIYIKSNLKINTPDPLNSTVTVKIHCLDTKTGVREWEYKSEGEFDIDAWNSHFNGQYKNKPVYTNENIYYYSAYLISWGGPWGPQLNLHLLCLDSKTGTKKWEFDPKGIIENEPLFFKDFIYISYEDDYDKCYMLCLDAGKGVKKWQQMITCEWTYKPATIKNGMVYFDTGDDTAPNLNALTGAIIK